MNKLVLQVVTVAFGISVVAAVHGHPATERYIPIGYWADVSNRVTYIGKIKSHVDGEHALNVEGPAGYKSIRITEDTHIWLDRTGLRMTNLEGSYDDCREGRTIEVKFKGADTTEAEWVKVKITRR